MKPRMFSPTAKRLMKKEFHIDPDKSEPVIKERTGALRWNIVKNKKARLEEEWKDLVQGNTWWKPVPVVKS